MVSTPEMLHVEEERRRNLQRAQQEAEQREEAERQRRLTQLVATATLERQQNEQRAHIERQRQAPQQEPAAQKDQPVAAKAQPHAAAPAEHAEAPQGAAAKKPEQAEATKKPEQNEAAKSPEQTAVAKSEQAEPLKKTEAEAPKKTEQAEPLKKTEQAEAPKQPEQAEPLKKPEQAEAPKKPEQAEAPKKPEQAEAPKKPEQAEAPKKPEQAEAPKKPEQAEAPPADHALEAHGRPGEQLAHETATPKRATDLEAGGPRPFHHVGEPLWEGAGMGVIGGVKPSAAADPVAVAIPEKKAGASDASGVEKKAAPESVVPEKADAEIAPVLKPLSLRAKGATDAAQVETPAAVESVTPGKAAQGHEPAHAGVALAAGGITASATVQGPTTAAQDAPAGPLPMESLLRHKTQAQPSLEPAPLWSGVATGAIDAHVATPDAPKPQLAESKAAPVTAAKEPVHHAATPDAHAPEHQPVAEAHAPAATEGAHAEPPQAHAAPDAHAPAAPEQAEKKPAPTEAHAAPHAKQAEADTHGKPQHGDPHAHHPHKPLAPHGEKAQAVHHEVGHHAPMHEAVRRAPEPPAHVDGKPLQAHKAPPLPERHRPEETMQRMQTPEIPFLKDGAPAGIAEDHRPAPQARSQGAGASSELAAHDRPQAEAAVQPAGAPAKTEAQLQAEAQQVATVGKQKAAQAEQQLSHGAEQDATQKKEAATKEGERKAHEEKQKGEHQQAQKHAEGEQQKAQKQAESEREKTQRQAAGEHEKTARQAVGEQEKSARQIAGEHEKSARQVAGEHEKAARQAKADQDKTQKRTEGEQQKTQKRTEGRQQADARKQQGETDAKAREQEGRQQADARKQQGQSEKARLESEAERRKHEGGGGILGAIGDFISSAFHSLMDAARSAWNAAVSAANAILNAAMSAARAIRDAAASAVRSILEAAERAVEAIGQAVMAAIQAIEEGRLSDLLKIGEKLVSDLSAIGQKLASDLQAIGQKLVNDLQTIAQKLGDDLKAIATKLVNDLKEIAHRISAAIDALKKAVADAVQAAWDWVKEQVAAAGKWLSEQWEKFKNWAEEAFVKFWTGPWRDVLIGIAVAVVCAAVTVAIPGGGILLAVAISAATTAALKGGGEILARRAVVDIKNGDPERAARIQNEIAQNGEEAAKWYQGVDKNEGWGDTLKHGGVMAARGALEGAISGLAGGASGALGAKAATMIGEKLAVTAASSVGGKVLTAGLQWGARTAIDAGVNIVANTTTNVANAAIDVATGERTWDEAWKARVAPGLTPGAIGAQVFASGALSVLAHGGEKGGTALQDRVLNKIFGGGEGAANTALQKVEKYVTGGVMSGTITGVQGGLTSMASGGSFADGFGPGFVGGVGSHVGGKGAEEMMAGHAPAAHAQGGGAHPEQQQHGNAPEHTNTPEHTNAPAEHANTPEQQQQQHGGPTPHEQEQQARQNQGSGHHDDLEAPPVHTNEPTQKPHENTPIQDQIEHATGVNKGPEHEAAQQQLREMYEQQQREAHQADRVSRVLDELPGTGHIEVVPDSHEGPLGPNQMKLADARKVLRTVREMRATESGRQALAQIEQSGSKLTFEPGVGSFRQGDRINVDPNLPSAQHAAGTLVHEAHHAATYDRDVNINASRDDYVHAALRNEAEAQAALLEHHREAGARSSSGGADEYGHQVYHEAYDRAAADYRQQHPTATEAEIHAHARAAGTDALHNDFANAVPSTSVWTNPATGQQEIRPGAPRNYEELYGSYHDQNQAWLAAQNALNPPPAAHSAPTTEPSAPHAGATPEHPLPQRSKEALEHSGKMTPEEIALVEGALRKDAQASRTGAPGEHQNADGSTKVPLTPEETAALIKAHDILQRDIQEGALVRKVLPNRDVGALLHGETVRGGKVLSTDQMRGDIALARNTDGLNAEGTIARLGLDYEHNPSDASFGGAKQGQYTDVDAAGNVRTGKEVTDNGLHFIDMPMTRDQAEQAKVPLAPDLYAAAKTESENPNRYTEKAREGGQDNPYTGTGHAASNRLTDEHGRPFDAVINQEMGAGAHPLQDGAQLKVRGDAAGADQVVATYKVEVAPDGTRRGHWELSPDLTPAQRAYYEAQIKTARDAAAAARGVSSPGPITSPAPLTPEQQARLQYEQEDSRRRAIATTQNADRPLEPTNPNRSTQGHGHGDHGWETTEAQQSKRIREGETPSGRQNAQVAKVTHFHSPEAEAEALGRARTQLDADLRSGSVPQFDPATGEPYRHEVDVETNRPDGFGTRVVKQKDASGHVIKDSSNKPLTETERRQKLDPATGAPMVDESGNPVMEPVPMMHAKVVFEYVPSTGEWHPVTYYPRP